MANFQPKMTRHTIKQTNKQKINNTLSRDKPINRTRVRYNMDFGTITQGILNAMMNIFEGFSSEVHKHFL